MSLFRQAAYAAIFLALAFGGAREAFAETQSSSNYINVNPSTVPAAQVNVHSANYQIDGSIEPMVGAGQSANYLTQTGVPFQPPAAAAAAAATVSGGGSSGGGGYIPFPSSTHPTTDSSIPQPTLNLRRYTFKSVQTIFGDRPGPGYEIEVNGSTDSVRYTGPTTWQRDLPLFIGVNEVLVATKISSEATSLPVRGEIERILTGDVDRNHRVDDADLSLFTRAWSAYSFFADFSEDSVIDDADLSLLASHWGRSW